MDDLNDRVGVAIASASAVDTPMLIALWGACGLTRPWNDPTADIARALRDPASDILVVRDGPAVIGSVMVGHDGHRGWVYYLAVDGAQRRRGIARALMAAAERWLRERDAPKIQLMVREGNTDALAFYMALGFRPQPVTVVGKFLD